MRLFLLAILSLAALLPAACDAAKDDEYFARLWAVQIVGEALKPQSVSFWPQAFKRAPDGAVIVAGIVTVRGRDLAYQLRVERICERAAQACYNPKLVYLGKPPD